MKQPVIGLFGRVMNNNECCLMLTSALIGCFTVALIRPFSGSRYFIRMRYLLSVPFWIKTPSHPCTAHPLHSLEHYISMICHFAVVLSFIYNTCRTSDDSAGACLEQGRVYEMLGRSDPNCCVTVGVMFWFACLSVVFFSHKIYRRRELWCLRLTVCHFHVQNCYYLTVDFYFSVKTNSSIRYNFLNIRIVSGRSRWHGE